MEVDALGQERGTGMWKQIAMSAFLLVFSPLCCDFDKRGPGAEESHGYVYTCSTAGGHVRLGCARCCMSVHDAYRRRL